MNILHLFSNYKWTGPAEPACQLVRALQDLGVNADIAVGSGEDQDRDTIPIIERSKNIGLEPITSMYLSKHQRILKNWSDKRTLRDILNNSSYDLIHTHMDNDHRIAAGGVKRAKNDIPIVRHMYQVEDIRAGFRNWFLYRYHTDAACAISPDAQNQAKEAFQLPEERMECVEVPIDLDRFDAGKNLPDLREKLEIPEDAYLVGIVARVQERRRFDLFIEAMDRFIDRNPDAYCVIVGRGTKIQELAIDPVHERNLEDRILFPGYLRADEYVGMLDALDVKVYLVPGTDGSCRAVRECLSMGIPVVSSRRGILPFLVKEGETGLHINENPEDLVDKLETLKDDETRNKLATNALDRRRRFSPEQIAEQVVGLYDRILSEES